jgi:hypothetical protein
MKTVRLFSLFALMPLICSSAETAYTALRSIGNERGAEILSHVVEVRGLSGLPQPQVWKVVVDDPQARGGIRELEFQSGRIVSERTPVSRSLGGSVNFNQLNLDSEGAFAVANQEAQKNGLAFHSVDYLLKSGSASGAPVWELRLRDSAAIEVGCMKIAADTGSVLEARNGSSGGGRASEASRPSIPRSSEVVRDRDLNEQDEPIRGVSSFFRRVGKHFVRRGNQIRDFITH